MSVKIWPVMLAEAKIQAVHLLVRGLAEYAPKLAKTTHLELKPEATLQSAQDLDRKEGQYAESARHYFTVYQGLLSPREKAEALISLSQELINCGSFRQARQFLKRSTGLIPELSREDKQLFLAQVEGKYGWIADYELGYQEELRRFMSARVWLSNLKPDRWGDAGEELHSTSFHFSGRARLGLADAGVDREANITLARGYFITARHLDEKLMVPTINEKVGHGYAWEARCHLRAGEMAQAYQLSYKVLESFQEHQRLFPESRIMAHYYLFEGERYLRSGNIGPARTCFQTAVHIRKGSEGVYPKGVADALAGIAATYWREERIVPATSYFLKAVRINPQVFFKGLLGG